MDEDTHSTEEDRIIELFAEDFNFKLTPQGVTCNACGKHLSRLFIGKPLTDRMLDHVEYHCRAKTGR